MQQRFLMPAPLADSAFSARSHSRSGGSSRCTGSGRECSRWQHLVHVRRHELHASHSAPSLPSRSSSEDESPESSEYSPSPERPPSPRTHGGCFAATYSVALISDCARANFARLLASSPVFAPRRPDPADPLRSAMASTPPPPEAGRPPDPLRRRWLTMVSRSVGDAPPNRPSSPSLSLVVGPTSESLLAPPPAWTVNLRVAWVAPAPLPLFAAPPPADRPALCGDSTLLGDTLLGSEGGAPASLRGESLAPLCRLPPSSLPLSVVCELAGEVEPERAERALFCARCWLGRPPLCRCSV